MSAHFESAHYASVHYESAHYGRIEIEPPEPPPFTPEGEGPPGTEDAEARWRRIQVEDDLIMLVIQAWLTMKDR